LSDSATQRFTGKERDSESGLDYFGARYYGSALGRFTRPDPSNTGANPANPQSWNGYAYVGNNPLGRVDPDGQTWQVCESTGSNCATIENDDDFDQFNKQTGNYVQGGNYYDSDGNQIGTASWSPNVDPTAGSAVAFLNFTLQAMTVSAASDVLGAFVLGPAIGRAAALLGKSGAAAATGLGDLTAQEVAQIQKVVDESGRPIEVVGSAAKGTRRGVGSDLPMGKGPGTQSDIDYIAPPSYHPYLQPLQDQLPGLAPAVGLFRALRTHIRDPRSGLSPTLHLDTFQ
jgi:RHS repeat-associated protein